jgi:hypothetical protein
LNVLSRDAQRLVLKLMCRSSGIGDIAEVTGHSTTTIRRQLARFGEALAASHDRLVRGVKPARLELDEIWAFVYATRASRIRGGPGGRPPPADFGEFYTWTALDPDSKLFITYQTGNRDHQTGIEFSTDLASRVISRPMISTDGFRQYADLIQRAFGTNMDHVIMEKEFAGFFNPKTGENVRYLARLNKVPQNQSKADVSRMTRRSYKFSKKLENHVHAFSVFVMYYNFVKAHAGLPKGERHLTPAIKAGLTTKVWTYDDLLDEVDEYWRRKTLKADLRIAPPPQYTALAPGAWSDRPYFVSYSPLKHKAKVHAANCRDCKRAGAGRKDGPKSHQWYAFETQGGARRCAETLAPLEHSVCSICIVGHYPGARGTESAQRQR